MALQVSSTIAKALEDEIVRRYELRGITKVVSAADRRKLVSTAVLIEEQVHGRALMVMRAFLDHVMPAFGGKSFRRINSIYFEWKQWSVEVYPSIKALFPVDDRDEEILTRFFEDWRNLKDDRNYYRSVYRRPGAIGGAKLAPAYKRSPDFFRVLAVLRHYQNEVTAYPLFTLRGYLAAQIEALSGFVPTLQMGNVVSEKAKMRFHEWYLYRFYSLELVKKGLKRPSENNPVSNAMVRIEYEHLRAGTGVGDFTFEDEEPVSWMTKPALPFGDGEVSDAVVEECEGIKLPPSMGDLLR